MTSLRLAPAWTFAALCLVFGIAVACSGGGESGPTLDASADRTSSTSSGSTSSSGSLSDGATGDASTDDASDGQAPAPGCSTGGWCWSNPLPNGNWLEAIWGATPNDVWSVGAKGELRHWDGVKWSSFASGTTADLFGVWGTASNDVWVVGDEGTVLRWDGGKWTLQPKKTNDRLRGVWGSSPNDVWIVGEGTILRWINSQFTSYSGNGTLYAVWGSAANDVWAVGDGGTIRRWTNTSAWSTVTSNTNNTLRAIIGFASNEVWATGYTGTIVRWNGSNWTASSTGSSLDHLAIWGTSAADVWVSGSGGDAYHWDGAWTPSPTGTYAFKTGAWGFGDSDVWFTARGGNVIRWNGVKWTSTGGGPAGGVWGMWGSGPNDIWGAVADSGEVAHWNGTKWSAEPSGLSYVRGMGGSGPDDVWAVGGPTQIAHKDAVGWSTMPSNSTKGMNAVWASSATDAWAVGTDGDGVHYTTVDGSLAWTPVTIGGDTNYAVYGLGKDAVWAAGQGPIRHWNGSAWATIDSTNEQWAGIWRASATEVWVVGFYGAITKCSATSCTAYTPRPSQITLLAIAGKADDDIYAAAQDGKMLHWNGMTWSPSVTGTTQGFHGMFATPTGGFFAGGDHGMVLQHP